MPKKHPSHKSLGLGQWIHIKPRERSGIQILCVSSGSPAGSFSGINRARVLASTDAFRLLRNSAWALELAGEDNFRRFCGILVQCMLKEHARAFNASSGINEGSKRPSIATGGISFSLPY
jgi:hypothetical protein